MAETVQADPINRIYSDEDVADVVLKCLGACQSGYYVSQKELTKSVNYNLDFTLREDKWKVSPRQVRHCIGLLRLKGADIISRGGVGGGYRLSRDYGEVREFVDRELLSRALDMLSKRSRMIKSAQIKYGGQIGLWDQILVDAPDDIMVDDLLDRVLRLLEDPDE